jgi:hypothetical protein
VVAVHRLAMTDARVPSVRGAAEAGQRRRPT